MPGERRGRLGRMMDGITERHTQEILQAARRRTRAKPVDPKRVAERRAELEQKGLLPLLETGAAVPVQLPGGATGQATGVSAEGFVIVSGWNQMFNPKAISRI